jgi:hypothetical protein
MLNHRAIPVIPSVRPGEPETLTERYHLDLTLLPSTMLAAEEGAIRLRCHTGRPSPRDLERLAGIVAHLSREERR